MKKESQSSVEWLLEQLTAIGQLEIPKGGNVVTMIINESKEMEKEQKIDFAKYCLNKALDLDVRTSYSQVEKYHNEIYKSE